MTVAELEDSKLGWTKKISTAQFKVLTSKYKIFYKHIETTIIQVQKIFLDAIFCNIFIFVRISVILNLIQNKFFFNLLNNQPSDSL